MLYEKFISSPQVKPIVFWNKIGTGTHSVQVLEVGTSNVLISMDVVKVGAIPPP
jgi:hypothetical protein